MHKIDLSSSTKYLKEQIIFKEQQQTISRIDQADPYPQVISFTNKTHQIIKIKIISQATAPYNKLPFHNFKCKVENSTYKIKNNILVIHHLIREISDRSEIQLLENKSKREMDT